jgi:hypothetical protein
MNKYTDKANLLYLLALQCFLFYVITLLNLTGCMMLGYTKTVNVELKEKPKSVYSLNVLSDYPTGLTACRFLLSLLARRQYVLPKRH